MNKIFIFSGTSEGRSLAEELAKKGIECKVFVATEYGQSVMKKNPLWEIHVGRMDKQEMLEAFRTHNPDYIVDATHPHAIDVTQNIKEACDLAGMDERYIRVSRSITDIDTTEYPDVIMVTNCDEARERLEAIDGNILLTTGVKELPKFVGDGSVESGIKERLVVRVLPGHESIALVESLGIPSKHIIAMEGPFSQEMNAAIIRQFDIKCLVTKNSGSRGGFVEKLDAAKKCGVKCIVLDSKVSDTGVSVEEAVNILCPSTNGSKTGVCYGVSVGPGDSELITTKAMQVIRDADFIFLPNAPKEKCKVYHIIKSAAPWIDEKNIVCDEGSSMTNPMLAGERYERLASKVQELLNQGFDVAFPALGSALLYSTYMYVHERLVERGYECKTISGITSIQETARVHGISLAQGDEEVHIFPDGDDLERKLELAGTKIFMKPKGELKVFTDRIKEYCKMRPDTLVYGVSNLGSSEEIIARGYEELDRLKGYMTVIIVKN